MLHKITIALAIWGALSLFFSAVYILTKRWVVRSAAAAQAKRIFYYVRKDDFGLYVVVDHVIYRPDYVLTNPTFKLSAFAESNMVSVEPHHRDKYAVIQLGSKVEYWRYVGYATH